MNLEDNNKQNKPIFAPLYIIKEEKLYLIWIVFVVFFGLINVWAGIFLGKGNDIRGAFEEGIVYTYSISILAPFLAEILIKQIVNKRRGETNNYLTYQVCACAVNIILIIILTFLWLGKYKNSFCLQILLGIISSFLSFYMYCIGQMDLHANIVGKYDDDKYLIDEKKRMNSTEEKSKKVERIEGEEGDIIL